MTRELLEQRLAELVAQKERAIMTASAVDGAIQETEFWMGQLALKEAAVVECNKPSIEEEKG